MFDNDDEKHAPKIAALFIVVFDQRIGYISQLFTLILIETDTNQRKKVQDTMATLPP